MRKPTDIDIHRRDALREPSSHARQPSRGLDGPATLHESRDALQAVIDAVPAMVNVKDVEYRYIFMHTDDPQ